MSVLGFILLPLVSLALLLVRREGVLLAVMAASFWSTLGLGVVVGSGYVPGFRIFLSVAAIRIWLSKTTFDQPLSGSDRFVLGMCAWTLLASLFHQGGPGSGFVYTAGIVFSLGFAYYLGRSVCVSQREVEIVLCGLAIVLLPIALEMILEKSTGRNLLAAVYGGSTDVLTRNGSLRAAGPFRHPILAGTVGAGCMPLFVALWARHAKYAVAGLLAASVMIVTSKSSGPVVSAGLAVVTLLFWKRRRRVPFLLGALGILYLCINTFSHRPAYYFFLTRLDMTGSSTGYYRGYLVDTAMRHLGEWWMIGTDYTIDWLPVGVGSIISGSQIDITNYFVLFGVLGGLLSVCLFTCSIAGAVRTSWRFVNNDEAGSTEEQQFFVWCFLAAVVANVASSMSVAYFDQSMLCFWVSLAITNAMPRHFILEREAEMKVRTGAARSSVQQLEVLDL